MHGFRDASDLSLDISASTFLLTGLGIKNFSLFDKVLKLDWVKRLCSNSDD